MRLEDRDVILEFKSICMACLVELPENAGLTQVQLNCDAEILRKYKTEPRLE